MKSTERVVAAYKAVDEAAPGLMVGNDPVSGYSILLHAAAVSLINYAPARAKALLSNWVKYADEEADRRAASEVQ